MRRLPPPRRAALTLVALLMSACAVAIRQDPGPGTAPPPNIHPVRDSQSSLEVPAPLVAPTVAFAQGWMPLAATGVDVFRARYPTYDGRGVLIGILDSGVDPGVAGLARAPDGAIRLLDLRDFSEEGQIALTPITTTSDTVVVGSHRMAGLSRLATFSPPSAPRFVGVLAERRLGMPPSADINANNVEGDSLLVVVTRGANGWMVFADTDGDRSIADEKPVRDYLEGRETFAWRSAGRIALTVAVNLRDGKVGGPPDLHLVFDNSGHGTHVAGIAAGASMYGVDGFDGVAPGARLLGLKIANNAHGGTTETGTMMAAIEYAIKFAAARRLPLVLNMSFGVGNEREGTPPIDRMIDSVLAAHPDVVFTISAGNDGPGLSTMGFPGSADRIISVGATSPGVFLPPRRDGTLVDDTIAFFSARGGELARPHVVAPGMAYSTVPPWDQGSEEKSGTSMAAPHVAGLAARLLSALVQEQKTWTALAVRQALMVTAHPVGHAEFIDEGTGLPNLSAAFEWLRAGHVVQDFHVVAVDHDTDAAFRGKGFSSKADTVQSFRILREGMPSGSMDLVLESSARWLTAPETFRFQDSAVVQVRYQANALAAPGTYTGVVTAWGPDRKAGPAFRLVNTVIVPHGSDRPVRVSATIPAGETLRVPFRADSARPFDVRVSTSDRNRNVLAFLHEPGGMPWRVVPAMPGGFGDQAADFPVDGRIAEGGVYEVVAVAQPGTDVGVHVAVDHAPFRVNAAREAVDRQDALGRRLVASLRSLVSDSVPVRVTIGMLGAERGTIVTGAGGKEERLAFVIPSWANRVEVEVQMDRTLWPRFTDFAVSLADGEGRLIETAPLNYAIGRLEATVPVGMDRPVELLFRPGLASPGSEEAWGLRASIRVYADQPFVVPGPADDLGQFTLAPGATRRVEFAMPDLPWTLGQAFYPLGILVADTGGAVWSREVPLPTVPRGVQP